MIRWPFSNLHTLNLNWLILMMKELETKVKEYATNVSASATTGAPGSQASATVTGNLDEGLNFSFTIPQGAQGPQGEPGQDGTISNIQREMITLGNETVTLYPQTPYHISIESDRADTFLSLIGWYFHDQPVTILNLSYGSGAISMDLLNLTASSIQLNLSICVIYISYYE